MKVVIRDGEVLSADKVLVFLPFMHCHINKIYFIYFNSYFFVSKLFIMY